MQCIDRLHEAQEFHKSREWERVQAESIFGVEIAPAIHLVGLVRVLLAGVQHPGLVLGDALQRPVENGHAQRFDVVVAVPPWGRRSSATLFPDHLPFKTNTLEASFLQLAMASLRPGGRAVLAMPDAFLFRGGAELTVRRWLLEEHGVDAVLQLPSESFQPYTGVRISLLVLTKGGGTQRVRFVDLNELGPTLDLDRDLDRILAFSREESTGGPVRVVAVDELAERDWTLIAPSAVEADFQAVIEELGQLERVELLPMSKLASIRNGLNYTRARTVEAADDPEAARGLIRVRDVGERRVQAPTLFARRELAARAKPGQVLRSRDVVVTTTASIGRVGAVTNGSIGCIATNGVVVLRPREQVSSRYLGALLRTPMLQELMKSQARGVGVQHLPAKALKGLVLPLPPLPIQERIAEVIEHRGGDALALLRAVLTEDTHPVVTFLESDPAVHGVRHLRNALAHGSSAMAATGSAQGPRSMSGSRSGSRSFSVSGSRSGSRSVSTSQSGSASSADDALAALRLFGKGLLRASGEVDDALRFRFSDEVFAWMRDLTRAAKGLAGPATDDCEPERVAVQVSTQAAVVDRLAELIRNIPEDLNPHARAVERALDSAWFLLSHASRSLVRDVTIEAAQVFPDGRQGTLFELPDPGRTVTLAIRNSGRAPVLEFEATLRLASDKAACRLSEEMLLGDQEEYVTASVPDDVGKAFRATLVWHGTTASLDELAGELALDLTVPDDPDAASDATPPSEALGSSPYIVGNPVDRAEMFFGRDDIIEKVRIHLSRDGVANVILLEGNRRTGKTSILKSLQRPKTLPSHVPVYCSFQASAGHASELGVPTDEVFQTIGRALAKDCTLAGCPLPVPGVPDDLATWPEKKRKAFVHMQLPTLVNRWFRERDAFPALDSLVQVALDAVAPKRLLLMLDEFDKLQEGIDSGVTSPQVPENIRYLFQNNTGMAGVLTGSRRIRRMREEYWNALFGFGFAVSVTALPQDAAAALVREPVAGRLAYQPDAVEQITTVCARHPFLIQLLCARVFNLAVSRDLRRVSVRDVDEAIDDMVRDNEHFRTLWGYAGSERARYLLWLCHDLQDGPDPVTFDLLQNQLETSRIGYGLAAGDGYGDGSGDGYGFGDGAGGGTGDGSGYGYGSADGSGRGDGYGGGRGTTGLPNRSDIVGADGLAEDLDHLRELELVSQEADGRYHVYRLAIPLMGLWIERNIDSRELVKLAVLEGRSER